MNPVKSTLMAGLAMILAAAAPALAGDAKVGDIAITGAWARASAGPVPNGAAFMAIANNGKEADKLMAADADVAKAAELHTHIHDGGVMKMRQVPAIDLPAGQTVMLQPGGFHVMFMGLKEPLKEGATFPLTLTFERAGKVTLDVAVGGPGAMGPAGVSGGMGGGMGMQHGHGARP
ncbi:MAG: copper chaperone PCu(A)C [Rhodospirillales bacterium]|nr:copper chaperone PCu(A)C [Rhodospirillales bacterium]